MIEVMISAGLGAVILAGVLAAFLMMGRSGYNASSYSTMDAESRRALEVLGVDARMASNIKWTDSSTITLTVAGAEVTYAYDSSATGATARSFYRKTGPVSSTATPLVLMRDIADFAFCRYKIVNGVDHAALNDLETKQIQITLRSLRSRATVASATNSILSARIVLRNKKVST